MEATHILEISIAIIYHGSLILLVIKSKLTYKLKCFYNPYQFSNTCLSKYSKRIEKGQQHTQQKKEILEWFGMYCFVVHGCHSPLQSFENQQYGFNVFSCKFQILTPHTCTLHINCKMSKKEPSLFPTLNSSIQLILLNPSTIQQLRFFFWLEHGTWTQSC